MGIEDIKSAVAAERRELARGFAALFDFNTESCYVVIRRERFVGSDPQFSDDVCHLDEYGDIIEDGTIATGVTYQDVVETMFFTRRGAEEYIRSQENPSEYRIRQGSWDGNEEMKRIAKFLAEGGA